METFLDLYFDSANLTLFWKTMTRIIDKQQLAIKIGNNKKRDAGQRELEYLMGIVCCKMNIDVMTLRNPGDDTLAFNVGWNEDILLPKDLEIVVLETLATPRVNVEMVPDLAQKLVYTWADDIIEDLSHRLVTYYEDKETK